MGNVGVAYIFEDDLLAPPNDPILVRLLPKNPQSGQNLGELSVAIGNPRGPGQRNLIMISAMNTTAIYCNGGEAVVQGGSVEIFDVSNPQPGGQPGAKANLSLVAPLHWMAPGPPWLLCNDRVPFEVHEFGHAIVLGDVTGDGVDDLVVGAPKTEVDGVPGQGRVYAFKGHANFLADPYSAWVGVDAPRSDDPSVNPGSNFGFALGTARLTNDPGGLVDLVVGRPDRDPLWAATAGQSKGGSAIAFRGAYLKSLFDGADGVTLNTTSGLHFEDVNPAVPEYQVLRNPFGDYQVATAHRWKDAYGWLVFSVGDIGSPPESASAGQPDGVEDIIVHAELTDYIGLTGTFAHPEVEDAGANFVYFGSGLATGNLVDSEHLLLMTPQNVGGPETHARFGRGTARVEWLHDRPDPLIDIVEPALFMSDPDATVGTLVHAGRVYLVRLPLPNSTTQPGWVPSAIVCAFELDLALEEFGGPVAWGIFGGWILALDYLGGDPSQPGEQLFISSRASPVGSRAEAGKFYTYTPYLN